MKNYRMLAIRYLKQNKQRSIITVLGTTLTVMILYFLLNVGWGYLLQTRQDMRESQDYEFVLFTETEDQIAEISADSRVKSAYVGQYYSYHHGEGAMYDHALYINTVNPYKLDSIFGQLCSTYDVEGDIHNELAWTYLQGSDGSFVVVVIYFSVLVAFIFAIVGVGIIRNSIQLCMFENIRDYGNLRCIGSAKKQLKGIIFLQGLVLELMGIIAGSILGTIVTIILSMVFQKMDIFHFQGGFHLLPLGFVLVTFLVDLYFAMGENAKLVTKMTPVSAIRGEYRIRKEKLRLHEKNPFRILLSKLFGVDGDYAFKSLMRNPGRFWRTVGALVFGTAAFMGLAGFASTIQNIMKIGMDNYKYYQIYIHNTYEMTETISQVEASFPSMEILQELSAIKEITDAKRSYVAIGYAPAVDGIYNHYTDEFMATHSGELAARTYHEMKDMLETAETNGEYPSLDFRVGFSCFGYDDTDLARYQSALTDGTLDLSENGIVLLNQVAALVPNESEYGNFGEVYNQVSVTYLDYQVGDTIDIVDIGKMHERLDPELAELNTEYWKLYEADLEEDPEDEDGSIPKIVGEYQRKVYQAVVECWQELAAEGCYKTYVIEGIVDEDVNFGEDLYGVNSVRIIMKQDTYFDLTGTDASQPTGMFYHLDRLPQSNKLVNLFPSPEDSLVFQDGLASSACGISWFVDSIKTFQESRKITTGMFLVVLFILTMSILNTINATSGNLQLRRRELAQLRVIGMSKKHLMRMVMLEGGITAVIAGIIGVLLGFVLSYGVFYIFAFMYGIPYHFPILVAVLAVILSVLVLCGAIYVPIKKLGNDMADDLKIGGD